MRDIKEQFPLDRDLTQEVAQRLGVTHPCYPGTHIPVVMTVDVLATVMRQGVAVFEAYNAKSDSDLEDGRELEKLEIQRTAFSLMDTAHHIVFDTTLPKQKVDTLTWLESASVKEGEVEPSPGYFEEMAKRFRLHASAAPRTSRLGSVCEAFDKVHCTEPGTGIRAARILMYRKEIGIDLNTPHPTQAPMSAFTFPERTALRLASGGVNAV